MATTELARSSLKSYRATAIAMIAGVASLIVVIVVVATMLLSQPATRIGQPGSVTSDRLSDYGLRHSLIAPNAGRLDDYGLRHPGSR
jgi:hypothetical protein